MNFPKSLVLVRHGEADQLLFPDVPNHQFPLTERGQEQASIVGRVLHERFETFNAYFCSTFRRTQETLTFMYPDAHHIVDERLNERWGGVWHTMLRHQVLEHYPFEERISKREGAYHYRAPGGQSGQDIDMQIRSFLRDLCADYADKKVLIAAHGNWMLHFWRLVMNKRTEDFEFRYANQKYANCASAHYFVENESIVVKEYHAPATTP